MITPDRLKAFLDDLALVSAKHGLFVPGGRPRDVEGMRGYVAVGRSGSALVDWEVAPIHCSASPLDIEGALSSLDVSTLTSHERIAFERSLAEIRERADG